jgi:glycosyltransferase involved in cell wall biosynthesis
MAHKLVSIIIPTYNYGRFVFQAISSCFDQTYQDIEVIVVDDGSTDDTRSVVGQFGDRITYLHQDNQGVSAARNAGLDRANGDFICFLDADDYLLPDAIESMVSVLSHKHDGVGMVIGLTCARAEKSCDIRLNDGWKHDQIMERPYSDMLLGTLSVTSPLIRGQLAKGIRFPSNITNGEDIAYYAKILFLSDAYLLARPVVVMVRHPDCLHLNINAIERQGNNLISAVFDDPFYKSSIEHLRSKMTALAYLSLFRSLYRAGRGKQGRKYYLQALKAQPLSILRLSYLSKFLRSFFRS